jgi:membrane protein
MSMNVPPKLRMVWELLRDTVGGFGADRGALLGGALAFYSLLSLAPLLIVAIAIAGIVLGPAAARGELIQMLEESMSPEVAAEINGWVEHASELGGIASVTGIALAIFSASRLFAKLRVALNEVLDVDESGEAGFRAAVKGYVRRRVYAFAMVLGAGVALLFASATRTFLSTIHGRVFGGSAGAAISAQILQVVFSLVLVAAVTAAILRLVPDTKLGWRSVAVGAAFTSVLFNVGSAILGIYLGRASVADPYGAAGTAVVVLLWINFSAQALLLGAELTRAYAARFGRGLTPEEEEEAERAEREAERHAARREAEPARDSKRRLARRERPSAA